MLCRHSVEHPPYDGVHDLMRAAPDALTTGGRLVVIVLPNGGDLRVIGEMGWLEPIHVGPCPMLPLDTLLLTTGYDAVQ